MANADEIRISQEPLECLSTQDAKRGAFIAIVAANCYSAVSKRELCFRKDVAGLEKQASRIQKVFVNKNVNRSASNGEKPKVGAGRKLARNFGRNACQLQERNLGYLVLDYWQGITILIRASGSLNRL